MKKAEAQSILNKILDGERVTPEQRHGAGKFWKQRYNSFCTQTETLSQMMMTTTMFTFTGLADREESLYDLTKVGMSAQNVGRNTRRFMSKAFPQFKSTWETIDWRCQRIKEEISEFTSCDIDARAQEIKARQAA